MERWEMGAAQAAAPRARGTDFFRFRLLQQPGFSAARLMVLALALPYYGYRSTQWAREKSAWLETARRYESQLEAQAAAARAQAEMQRQYESQMAAQMSGLSQPDLATSYVIAPQSQRGPDEAYPPVQFTPAANFLILTVRLSNAPAHDLTIEITDTARTSVWRKSGI